MRVIFPFTYFDNFYALRYAEQLKAIADNVNELNIVINIGTKVNLEHDNIHFHYDRLLPPNHIPNKYYVNNLKDNIAKFSLYAYWGKLPYIYKVAKRAMWVNGDVVLGMSGAGWQEVFHNLIGLKKDIPVVHRMRGYGKYERSISNNIFNRFFNDGMENLSYRMYNRFIPISWNFRRILLEQGIDYDKVSDPIGLGVNTDMFKPDGYDGEYIGFFGRCSKEKGIDFLLSLIRSTPDINYLIAGANDKNIVFPDNVEYVGRVKKTQMPMLINSCKAIIMPSLSEGIANGVLEAYACGKVVIGSPNVFDTSLPYYINPIEFNIEKWQKAIYGLEDTNLNSLSKQTRRWALNNSWSKFGEAIVKELEKVTQ